MPPEVVPWRCASRPTEGEMDLIGGNSREIPDVQVPRFLYRRRRVDEFWETETWLDRSRKWSTSVGKG